MSNPTPNGPTAADLSYAYYSAQTVNQFPLQLSVADSVVTIERILPDFVGYSFTVNVSDVLNTAESLSVQVGPFGPNGVSITVSDSVTLTENIATS